KTFKNTTDRPTLIVVDSHIAWGVPGKQDTSHAHGEPLGWQAIEAAKAFYGCSTEKFCVPDGVYDHFAEGIGKRGQEVRDAWFKKLDQDKGKHAEQAAQLDKTQKRELPEGWDKDLKPFPADAKGMGGRIASQKVLNMIAPHVPWLVGGSADLAPSTKTR